MSEPTLVADPQLVRDFCDARWDTEVPPLVQEHIRIPAVSPAYDPGWEADGHLHRAVGTSAAWLASVPLPGLRTEVLHAPVRARRAGRGFSLDRITAAAPTREQAGLLT